MVDDLVALSVALMVNPVNLYSCTIGDLPDADEAQLATGVPADVTPTSCATG